MNKVKIYLIVNPEDQSVIYVGASKHPEQRFKIHKYGLEWHICTKRYRTVKRLNAKGLSPILQIVEECEITEARDREQHWINYYRQKGMCLDQCPFSTYTGGIRVDKSKWIKYYNRINLPLASRLGIKA